MTRRDGYTWLFLAAVAALTLSCVFRQRPGVNSDPGWGIVAAEQFLTARSPSPLQMVVADAGDLSRDRTGTVAWWPPSYQLAPLVFRALSLDWGNALRCTFVAGWLLGAIGWAAVFAMTVGRGARLLLLLGAFLLLRFCHVDTDIYSGGEFLLWATAPYVVLTNAAALRRADARWQWALAAGLLTPWLFLVKYNAAFLIVGLGVCWTLFVLKRWISTRSWALFAAGGIASGILILLLGFPAGTTSFDPQVHVRLSWTILWPFGSTMFASTDWDSLLRWLLEHPSHPILADRHFEILYALAAPLVVAWIVVGLRRLLSGPAPHSPADVARALALMCLGCSATLLAFVSTEARSYLTYARYLRVESVMALPLLVVPLAAAMERGAIARRVVAAAGLVLFLLVPSAYGAVSLVDKGFVRATQWSTLVGPLGIRYAFFEPGERVARITDEIRNRTAQRSVLYLPSPELGLAFIDRRFVITHADFVPLEELAAARYVGATDDGVVLFVPVRFRSNGKLAAIEQSFKSVGHWREEPLQSTSSWILVYGSPERTGLARSAVE